MKKRILGLLLASVGVISLASCNKIDLPKPSSTGPVVTTNDPVTGTTTPETVMPTTTSGTDTPVTQTVEPTPTVVPTTVTPQPTVVPTTTTVVDENHKQFNTPEIEGELDPSSVVVEKKHFENSMKIDGPFGQDAFPSKGTPTMLVIPVNLDNSKKTEEIYNNIKLAFAGTEEETGWESVHSFYYKSSYEQLDIKFEFTDWFTPSHEASYYESYENGDEYGDEAIVSEAVKHFDSELDYSKYDYDNDGLVDNIWIVYNCPVDYEKADFWWAWQTKVSKTIKVDGKTICRYGFAGTDFMDPTKEEQSYDVSNIKVDAHTFIHESGHIMGLEDYYDYDENVGPTNRGLFAADMMDYNIGDHCSFNKMSLGWIDPTVVSGEGKKEITLKSFTLTGDVLLIANHELESIWDEYFLIEFYTNEGLNENDKPIGGDEDPNAIGIRILHVDAHLSLDEDGNVVPNGDDAYPESGFLYDNTGTKNPLIEMLRADYSKSMEDYLFQESLYDESSKTFGEDTWASFKLNDGSKLFFTLSVKSISNGECTVEINLM